MPSKKNQNRDSLREKLIGLGTGSIRKSYYPQLRARLDELERFRALLDQSNDVILLIDIKTRCLVDANQTTCRILGLKLPQLLKRPIQDFLSCDGPGDLLSRLPDPGQKPPEQKRGGCRLITSGGDGIPLEVTTNHVSLHGKSYMVVVGRDISQTLATKKALGVSESRYKAMVEDATDFVVRWRPDGERIFANQAYRRYLGMTAQEVMAGNVFDGIIKEDSERLRRAMAGLSPEHPVSKVEQRKIASDGSLAWQQWNNRGIFDERGRLVEIQAVGQDITERKNAEEALKASELYHRSLFEDSPTAIFVQDFSLAKERLDELRNSGVKDFRTYLESHPGELDRLIKNVRIIRANQAALDLYKAKSADELTGGIQKFIKQKDAGHFIDQMEQLLSGETFYEGEARNLDFEGNTIDIILRKAVIGGYESNSSRVMVAVTDVTELNRAHRERTHLESQLRQAQKMQAMGTLAGGVAHDFNNILAAITGYTELTLDSLDENDPNRHNLEQVIKASMRAKDLIGQILTFSRRTEARLRPLDLNNEVKQAVELFQRTLPKMVEIETVLAPDLHHIEGDKGQVEQILMNLASNASDAMPQGGRLVIETGNTKLDEEYCQGHMEVKPGDYVQLSISDTGLGMDKKTKAQIFDPFFTTKGVGEGTGLGLSTVFGIVKAHHAHITCYSELDRGTTFSIYFPAVYHDGKPGQRELPQEKGTLAGNETILLVDDERMLRNIGVKMLSRFGYQVRTAKSGEKALESYRKNKDMIDLIILDVSMPGMGGHQCLTELIKFDPDVKVIIASGYSRDGQLKDTMKLGARGYVAKPYRLTDLLQNVRGALDK